MEQKLEAAAARGVRTLILRGGDFFGPHTGSSWFSQGMVKRGAQLASVTYPGRRGVGHAWAYLPDFAEAGARLVEADARLATSSAFHFAGHWFAEGREIAERARIVSGRPAAPIRTFPWVAMMALSPFVPLFREMAEMRYLWSQPIQLDNARLVGVIGAEPHTDTDTALRATLGAMGCLPTNEERTDDNLRAALLQTRTQ
jgi:nucleoside-diphosphate-sugar epimerase